jgi:hypothetical protein
VVVGCSEAVTFVVPEKVLLVKSVGHQKTMKWNWYNNHNWNNALDHSN